MTKSLETTEIISPERTLEKRIEAVWIDIQMLKDGSWQPDDDSVDDTIENLEAIFHELKRRGQVPADYQLVHEDTANESSFSVVVD